MIVEGALCLFQWNCDQLSPVIFTGRTSVQPSTCPARRWVCLMWRAFVRPIAAAASVRTRVCRWPSPSLMSWDTSKVLAHARARAHTHAHTHESLRSFTLQMTKEPNEMRSSYSYCYTKVFKAASDCGSAPKSRDYYGKIVINNATYGGFFPLLLLANVQLGLWPLAFNNASPWPSCHG